MKRLLCAVVLLWVPAVMADTLALKNGETVTGRFEGFRDQQFVIRDESGAVRAEYAVAVDSLQLDSPARAALQLVHKQYDDVLFVRLEHNLLRFKKDGQSLSEPVVMLKRLAVLAPAKAAAEPRAGVAAEPATGAGPKEREWKRTGKWREMEEDRSNVISDGEEVDIKAELVKGMVNVVHFHYKKAVSSVRDGNYLQGLAARRKNHLVVRKVIVEDFNAPICRKLGLKTLPQFWFYSADGELVKKLTDRFTESDIDAAIREAARN